MPRYVGIIWPAVICSACALLMRLPTRPFRWIAITLVLGLNVTQSIARLTADTEPPFDRLAADVAAAPQAQLTYLQSIPELFGAASKYYLSQYSNDPMDLRKFRVGPNGRPFVPNPRPGDPWEGWGLTINYDLPAKKILDDLKQHPQTKRIVVWEMPGFSLFSSPLSQQVAKGLGPDWHLASDREFHRRMYWTWGEMTILHRKEFVKEP
jgi:hypothetical protein